MVALIDWKRNIRRNGGGKMKYAKPMHVILRIRVVISANPIIEAMHALNPTLFPVLIRCGMTTTNQERAKRKSSMKCSDDRRAIYH